MRYIKFALAGVVILFVLFTAIGLLMPSSITISRSVDINKSADSVQIYSNNISQWKYWLNGADETSFKIANSNKIVLGTYTISVIENKPEYIITLWQSNNTRKQTNTLQLFKNSATSTKVTWIFQQRLQWYFWERLSGMLYDNLYGPSIEASLNNLKQVCENGL